MSNDPTSTSFNPTLFMENMVRAGELWQHIAQHSFASQLRDLTPSNLDPMQLRDAWMDALQHVSQHPARFMEIQADMVKDYMQFWQHTTQKMLGQTQKDYIQADSKDRRFRDDAWNNSLIYDTLRQSYLMANKWARQTLSEMRPHDKHKAAKLDFFARHYLDALSPSNFLATNPEVMRAAIESNGESIVRGLSNLLEDIERGGGKLNIRTTDYSAFELGKNIACTPGTVVFQNDLIQLIQYAPSTEKAFRTPLLIMPAWINKYYILDLRPENSFVKWAVAQGHTVFMVSWVNPDASLSHKTFEDYLKEGPLAALEAIEKITGETSVNAIGYCLGGTLLAIALSYLQQTGQSHRIKSATYLTTLVDFSECGEIGVFIDDAQLHAMEARMSEAGYLDGREMASTFSMLRANDMIWSFVVNNYLLGKDPFPFDLLYWNADSTRMPAKAHSFYLREMYQANRLVVPAALTMLGVPVNLSKIQTPSYVLSTREDHIAPWQSTYIATQLYDGPVTFTLADSGHVAGVISAPGNSKYGFYSSTDLPGTPQRWLEEAQRSEGSWWPHWQAWISPYCGEKITARTIRQGKKKLSPAPGSYALEQA